MSSIWTVAPDTARIDLVYRAGDGSEYPFTITVKKYLNVGEARRVMTAGWKGVKQTARGTDDQTPEISIDWKQQTFARTEAYLVDWSLTDDAGKKLSMKIDGLQALKSDVYTLIEDAITAHVEASTEEKKATTDEPPPRETSG